MLVVGVQEILRRPGLQQSRAFDALLADSGQKQPVVLRAALRTVVDRVTARLIIVGPDDHPVATGFGGCGVLDVIPQSIRGFGIAAGREWRGARRPLRGRGSRSCECTAMTPQGRAGEDCAYRRHDHGARAAATPAIGGRRGHCTPAHIHPGDSTDRIRGFARNREQDRPSDSLWCPRGRAWVSYLSLYLSVGVPARLHALRFARHLRGAHLFQAMLTCTDTGRTALPCR